MTDKTLLITGASGFVGHHLLLMALQRGFKVRAVARDPARLPSSVQPFVVGELDANNDWYAALVACDSVIHLAGRAHIMHETDANCLNEYRRINTAATLNLATQAARQGVKRFIYVSSIKVNGEVTLPGKPFDPNDIPEPVDPYGVSKWEAELGLKEIAFNTGMEVVIVRPPLIYGPGVKANFAALISALKYGLPLPLGSITDNRRSFVGIDNLCDFLLLCAIHPSAANQTFLVSDGEDLSTAQLLKRLGIGIGYQARLMPVPCWILEWGAKLVGKYEKAQRLLGDLQVDIQKNREFLNWNPPVSVDEGFRRLRANGLVDSYETFG